MQVKIDGRHFAVTEDVKKEIEKGTEKFNKFLHNIVEAHIILDVEKYRYSAEIILLAKHRVFKCKEVSNDIHISLERALRNMERQLRQHKEKVKEHTSKHIKEIPVGEGNEQLIV